MLSLLLLNLICTCPTKNYISMKLQIFGQAFQICKIEFIHNLTLFEQIEWLFKLKLIFIDERLYIKLIFIRFTFTNEFQALNISSRNKKLIYILIQVSIILYFLQLFHFHYVGCLDGWLLCTILNILFIAHI